MSVYEMAQFEDACLQVLLAGILAGQELFLGSHLAILKKREEVQFLDVVTVKFPVEVMEHDEGRLWFGLTVIPVVV